MYEAHPYPSVIIAHLPAKPIAATEMEVFVNLLEADRMPRMTKSWNPQVPHRMDKYLTPDQLKLSVLRSPRMVALIDEQSNNSERNRKQLQVAVREILDEIGLACSMPVIRWSGICLNHILLKICTGVHVNDGAMQRLKATIGDRPVLYLPSHRSYLDFVLMSYVCFAYDLTIPGIAAGMDFHGMAGIGRLIRRTCAFFMRRTFTADSSLYWQVFEEYMHQLVTAYHTGVEFFIEGTRSRSLKALPPKIGLLSMALQPLFAGEVPDITIVPIGVGYERPLEEQLFAYEMLGVPKPKESTLALFKAIKILDTQHGNVYINFGKPISARAYFGDALQRFAHAILPVHVQHLNRPELAMVGDIGQHIVVQQQRLIVVTVFNLVATVFNYCTYSKRPTDMRTLVAGVAKLAALLRSLGAVVELPNDASGAPAVRAAVIASFRVHGNLFRVPPTTNTDAPLELLRPQLQNGPVQLAGARTATLRAHQLAVETLRNAVPVLTLQCYANPCMFWLAGPAFVLLAVRELQPLHHNVDDDATALLRAAIQRRCARLRSIFCDEFVLPDKSYVEQALRSLCDCGVLDGRTLRIAAEPDAQLVLSALVPFLLCYHQVADTIATEYAAREFVERELFVLVQKHVEAAIEQGRPFVHPYCLSLDSIAHALHAFQATGYLTKIRSANDKEAVYKCSNPDSVRTLNAELLHLCRLLPFGGLHETSTVLAKL